MKDNMLTEAQIDAGAHVLSMATAALLTGAPRTLAAQVIQAALATETNGIVDDTPVPQSPSSDARPFANALAELVDCFLERHGCFPLDNPKWKAAMTEAYRLVGQPDTPARMNAKPNDPEREILAGVECFVYPASQYAAVDADVADERKGDKSAGVVAREISRWAGIRSAENLRWMLDEMLADSNRAAFKSGQVTKALKALLFALHARPMHGYPLLTVEDAIAQANEILDVQAPGASA